VYRSFNPGLPHLESPGGYPPHVKGYAPGKGTRNVWWNYPLREEGDIPILAYRQLVKVQPHRYLGIILRAGTIRPGIPPDKDMTGTFKVVAPKFVVRAIGIPRVFRPPATGMPVPHILNGNGNRHPLREEGDSARRVAQVHNRRTGIIPRTPAIRLRVPSGRKMPGKRKAAPRQVCRHAISMRRACYASPGMPIPVIYNGITNGEPLREKGDSVRR
jgi:hypothetical protein